MSSLGVGFFKVPCRYEYLRVGYKCVSILHPNKATLLCNDKLPLAMRRPCVVVIVVCL